MWHDIIEDYCAWLKAGGRSAGTIKIRRRYLRSLAGKVSDPWAATPDDLVRWLSDHTWKPETLRSARSTARSLYQWGVRTGRTEKDPSWVLPPIPVPRPRPRPTPDAVFRPALEAAGDRLEVMLMLGAYCGLRRAEISRVHSKDVEGDLLRVVGKGGKVRMIPLPPVLLDRVTQARGWVFPGQMDGHLSPHWVGVTLGRALGPGWTAHTLRHRAASRGYAADRDLRAIQEFLGHASIVTTQIYTAVPDDAIRRAVMAAVA